MDDTDYNVLKNSLKEIVCSVFTNCKKEYSAKKIYGMILCRDIFELVISMGIFTDEHIKNNSEYLLEIISDEENWCEIIKNNELNDFNNTLSEKLPIFCPPIKEEADWETFIDSSTTLLKLTYNVLDELNKEQYFKEFGNDFILLFVNDNGPGAFVLDIKKDKDWLFDYKLSGWYREIGDSCYDVEDVDE
jgi:hypothetical protein